MKERGLGLHAGVLLLAFTHFVIDTYSNILAPLLPVFIPQMQLSLAAAGLLQTIFQMSSSVSQLAFGHLADRWRHRPLLVAGPLLSVVVLPLVGLAQDPATLAAILIVGGLGGAAFHPPAAALVHTLSGPRACRTTTCCSGCTSTRLCPSSPVCFDTAGSSASSSERSALALTPGRTRVTTP